ncbi:MAG: hypothetical protein J6B10_05585 [Lachnospiraceae bacterium]|nr:hypothetical protein [Lachnospiraceae bacterium]
MRSGGSWCSGAWRDYGICGRSFDRSKKLWIDKGRCTGIAYYIGVNLTRSLLFCAGPFDTQQETRLRAIAVLVSIGMEQAIGLQDNATAETVLKALIGEQR